MGLDVGLVVLAHRADGACAGRVGSYRPCTDRARTDWTVSLDLLFLWADLVRHSCSSFRALDARF